MRFHVGELNALTAAVRLFIICHSPIQDPRLSLVQQAKGRGQASGRDTTSLHFSISVSFGWRLERTTLETFPRVLVVGPGAKPFMADDHARAISRYFFFFLGQGDALLREYLTRLVTIPGTVYYKVPNVERGLPAGFVHVKSAFG